MRILDAKIEDLPWSYKRFRNVSLRKEKRKNWKNEKYDMSDAEQFLFAKKKRADSLYKHGTNSKSSFSVFESQQTSKGIVVINRG